MKFEPVKSCIKSVKLIKKMFNLVSDIVEYLIEFNKYLDLISFTATCKTAYKFRNSRQYINIRDNYHKLPFSIRTHSYTQQEYFNFIQEIDNDLIEYADNKIKKVFIDGEEVGYLELDLTGCCYKNVRWHGFIYSKYIYNDSLAQLIKISKIKNLINKIYNRWPEYNLILLKAPKAFDFYLIKYYNKYEIVINNYFDYYTYNNINVTISKFDRLNMIKYVYYFNKYLGTGMKI